MSLAADPLVGTELGRYRVEQVLGSGGMSVVYRARDLRLGRLVAVKVLEPAARQDAERRRRFLREARTASSLNHPGIVTIHEVDSAGDVDYIVMELVPGRSLADRLAEGALPLAETASLGTQLAAALEEAHAAGIVHRDLKPGNVVVTPDQRVKVLDFGLARAAAPDGRALEGDGPTLTRSGVLLGTPGHMSPEQILGGQVGPPSDVFCAGIILYQMLSGRRPFEGRTVVAALASILDDSPPKLTVHRPDTPPELARLVEQCLEKDPARRPSARELRQRLETLAPTRELEPQPGRRPRRRSPVTAAALVLSVLATGAAGWAWWERRERQRWARAEAPAEVRRLAGEGKLVAALRLAGTALELAPDDAQLRQEWANLGIEVRIESEPPGAEVAYTDYLRELPWQPLGRTPLERVRLPRNALWRLSLPGHRELEATGEVRPGAGLPRIRFVLEREGSAPEGMVRVPEGRVNVVGTEVAVPAFWVDRHEVTNREFKAFVDAGGYRDVRLWREPFAEGGRVLRFEQAVRAFVDATGRPGPATWELGAPPAGREDHPVGGVSWYEAAAYARFAGKELPTLHHWARAAGLASIFSDVLTASNFGGDGSAARAGCRGVGPFGTCDMAGNVKEWTRTAVADRRYILGGSWNEPPYTYRDLDARPTFERLPQNGVRCMRSIAAVPPELEAPIERTARDFTRERPAGDGVFAAYARLYAYDPLPLEARVEAIDDSSPHWRKETVSYAAAYGGERVPAYVFVPRSARPPYQAVVFHPGADGMLLASSREPWLQWVEFVVRSGRLLVYPVLKGMYERRVSPGGQNTMRDTIVQRSKDVGRTVDYLLSRRDVDGSRIAYYGLSLGAQSGLTAVAMEPRFRTVVLAGGGIFGGPDPPEVDELNFAPRVRVPTLMINGRHDFDVPLETAQKPLFRLLGCREDQKKHVLLDGGHIPSAMSEVIREVVGWLDERLGPVR